MADEDILREIADRLAQGKSRSEMIGELLREIAVLSVVFVPLEAVFNPGRLLWWQVVVVVAVALAVEYVGLRVEEMP